MTAFRYLKTDVMSLCNLLFYRVSNCSSQVFLFRFLIRLVTFLWISSSLLMPFLKFSVQNWASYSRSRIRDEHWSILFLVTDSGTFVDAVSVIYLFKFHLWLNTMEISDNACPPKDMYAHIHVLGCCSTYFQFCISPYHLKSYWDLYT